MAVGAWPWSLARLRRARQLPKWIGSIRFRLSFMFATAVFATGALLVGGIYLYQLSELDRPMLVTQGSVFAQSTVDGREQVTRFPVLPQGQAAEIFLRNFQTDVRRAALNDFRTKSLQGLGVLFIVAFSTGWVASGWVLRPLSQMASTARRIGAGELSQRVSLTGQSDELKDLADTFDGMLDRIQELVETNRQFVQDMSHELRNPLAIAQANLELALDDPDVDLEGALTAARLAHRSNSRMTGLIDDLLAQARLGVPQRSMQLVDPADLSAEVAAETQAQAESAGVTVVVDRPPPGDDAPLMVRADRAAIRRAITNLVINAVRYAPEGSEVAITVRRNGDRGEILVRDDGPGIDQAYHERIFERFWQGGGPTAPSASADGSDAASAGGSGGPSAGLGLGLSIVRQIAQAHGGTVSVISASGEGATFILRLPVAGSPDRD